MQVQGGDGNTLHVKGHKNLFGSTAEEARSRSGQVVLTTGRRQDIWCESPYEGERWGGVNFDHDRHVANYVDSRQEWESTKSLWQKDETLSEFLPDLLSGEVVSVVAAGRRVEGIFAPYPLEGEAVQEFYAGYASSCEGLAFGPAASVVLNVTVPPCGNVILFGPSQAIVENLDAGLFVAGPWPTEFSAQGIRGHVFSCGAAPTRLEDVTGNLWLNDANDHRGGELGEKRLHRIGQIPIVRIRRQNGSVQVRCRCLHLDMKGIGGDIDIANDFGRTRLLLDESWPSDHTANLNSVSGSIDVTLTAAADERLSLGVWTECGTIDRSRWPTGRSCYNAPHAIYLGTKSEQYGADICIRTRSGDVRIIRK